MPRIEEQSKNPQGKPETATCRGHSDEASIVVDFVLVDVIPTE